MMPYYSNLEKWPNLYACQIFLGGSCGNNLKNIKLLRVVLNYACVVKYGVNGGSGVTIYRLWMTGLDYDYEIDM